MTKTCLPMVDRSQPHVVVSWDTIMSDYQDRLNYQRMARMYQCLGLLEEAGTLEMYRVGWCPDHQAFAWPMYDGDGRMCGIRTRDFAGNKSSITGSRSGMFMPELEPEKRVFVCEGPTDCFAMTQLGYFAVGRPDAQQGNACLRRYFERHRSRDAVIVMDCDEPGQRGAYRLADELLGVCRTVRVVMPPAKDARQWVVGGATTADVEAAVGKVANWERGMVA